MDPLIDSNRFVIRTSDGVRADRYYPELPFWIFRDPSVPVPTLSTLDALILLQRILREPRLVRVTITRMTPDIESGLRTLGPKGVRALESYLNEG